MSIYKKVVDDLLRNSLLEQDEPDVESITESSDLEVEIGLLAEADEPLLNLWYYVQDVLAERNEAEQDKTDKSNPRYKYTIPTPKRPSNKIVAPGVEVDLDEPAPLRRIKPGQHIPDGDETKVFEPRERKPGEPEPKYVARMWDTGALPTAKKFSGLPKGEGRKAASLPGHKPVGSDEVGREHTKPRVIKRGAAPAGAWKGPKRGRYTPGVDEPGPAWLPGTPAKGETAHPLGMDNAKLHKTLHAIAGIEDSHHMTPEQRQAIGDLMTARGAHPGGGSVSVPEMMGYNPRGHRDPAKDRAAEIKSREYLGVGERSAQPYAGLISLAKSYAKKNTDEPQDAHKQLWALFRRMSSGYDTKALRDLSGQPKSLTTRTFDKEGKASDSQAAVTGQDAGRRQRHLTGAESLSHDVLLPQVHALVARHFNVDPADAKYLHKHFVSHYATSEVNQHGRKADEHDREANKLELALRKAKTRQERSDLLDAIENHYKLSKHHRKRAAAAHAAGEAAKAEVERLIKQANASLKINAASIAKAKLAGNKEELDRLTKRRARLDQIKTMLADPSSEDSKRYQVLSHFVANVLSGGADVSKPDSEEEADKPATESVSLFDLVLAEAKKQNKGPFDDEGFLQAKPETLPHDEPLGGSGLPAGLKQAIADKTGMSASTVTGLLRQGLGLPKRDPASKATAAQSGEGAKVGRKSGPKGKAPWQTDPEVKALRAMQALGLSTAAGLSKSLRDKYLDAAERGELPGFGVREPGRDPKSLTQATIKEKQAKRAAAWRAAEKRSKISPMSQSSLKGEKPESNDEGVSLFGAIFNESVQSASLFSAVFSR